MKVALGSDHRGVHIKRRIANFLRERHHEVLDFGTDSEDSVDYPDFAAKVSEAVSRGDADRGVLICGTGIGMCIAANKIAGVLAACVHDDVTAELSRSHNNSNVLCLSADLLGERSIDQIVDIWMKTKFEGGRHARRVEKIAVLERRAAVEPETAESGR
ncbi:MAG: ribose 5-phosphate isomerase B [Planctomycetia bacterium]